MAAENDVTLEGLVCQNRMPEAIERLKSLIEDLKGDSYNSLIGLSGRLQAVRRDKIDGTADGSDPESNRIRAAFLSVLSDIREEIQSKVNFFKPIPRSQAQRDTLRDFVETVLSKKYDNIKPFNEGNTFIYFTATEKHSEMAVMVMILKSSDINEIMQNNQLSRIAQLKHRNLIQLLDVNFQTYPFYIITEYVSGINLKKLMAETGSFPLHNAKRLILIIGDVMNSLRQKKFPHAGIRPSKILIDHELEPEISPFDILRISDTRRLLSSFIEDSYYFAPERLYELGVNNKNEEIDRANQFCIAALMFEMLSGEKLFAGQNVSDIMLSRHRFFTDLEFRKTRFIHPRIPSRMATILKKMLNQNPEKRYDDLPTALREIGKVRADLDPIEEKVFASYRRCLTHTEDFVGLFLDNLFGEAGMGSLKNLKSEEKLVLQQKFYISLHLIFDVENAVIFLRKVAEAAADSSTTAAEYIFYFDVLLKTVEECDPRWHGKSSDTPKAWGHIKMRILDSLQDLLPTKTEDATTEDEVKTLVLETIKTDVQASIDSAIPLPKADDHTNSEVSNVDLTYPVTDGEAQNKIDKDTKIPFDPEKP